MFLLVHGEKYCRTPKRGYQQASNEDAIINVTRTLAEGSYKPPPTYVLIMHVSNLGIALHLCAQLLETFSIGLKNTHRRVGNRNSSTVPLLLFTEISFCSKNPSSTTPPFRSTLRAGHHLLGPNGLRCRNGGIGSSSRGYRQKTFSRNGRGISNLCGLPGGDAKDNDRCPWTRTKSGQESD